MRKLTKPALNSQATLNRQGKHAKGTPNEADQPAAAQKPEIIKQAKTALKKKKTSRTKPSKSLK